MEDQSDHDHAEVSDRGLGMSEIDHPGFPPKYWELLGKAAQEMDKAEACPECMASWRSHGPAHYRAIRNEERCAECAVRAALPVERAVLDWQYDHDPLKTMVKKVVGAYRAYRKAREGIKDIHQHWEDYLNAHETKEGAHPQDIRGDRVKEDRATMKEFWNALHELDGIIPKEL